MRSISGKVAILKVSLRCFVCVGTAVSLKSLVELLKLKNSQNNFEMDLWGILCRQGVKPSFHIIIVSDFGFV